MNEGVGDWMKVKSEIAVALTDYICWSLVLI